MKEEPILVIEVFRIRQGQNISYGWVAKRLSTTREYLTQEDGKVDDHRRIFQSVLGSYKADLLNPRLNSVIRNFEKTEIAHVWDGDAPSMQISPVNEFVMDEIQDNLDAFKRAEKAAALENKSTLPIANFGEPGNADVPHFESRHLID